MNPMQFFNGLFAPFRVKSKPPKMLHEEFCDPDLEAEFEALCLPEWERPTPQEKRRLDADY